MEVRPVPTVECRHHTTIVGIDTDLTRQAEKRQRLVEGDGVKCHAGEQRRGARLFLGAVHEFPKLHVRPEPSGTGVHVQTRLGVNPKHPAFTRRRQQLERLVECEFVRRQIFGDGSGVLATAHERSVLAGPGLNGLAVGVDPDGKGVEFAHVETRQVLDEGVQPAAATGRTAGRDRAVGAPVETTEPRDHLLFAVCDGVEVLFHSGGERVVDQ